MENEEKAQRTFVLNLNQEAMQEALQGTANKALEEAFSDWEVRKQIKETVCKTVLQHTLTEAIGKAVENVDKEALVANLSVHLVEAVGYSLQNLIADSFARVLFEMRGHHSYDTGSERVMANIRQEIIAACGSLRRPGGSSQ